MQILNDTSTPQSDLAVLTRTLHDLRKLMHTYICIFLAIWTTRKINSINLFRSRTCLLFLVLCIGKFIASQINNESESPSLYKN